MMTVDSNSLSENSVLTKVLLYYSADGIFLIFIYKSGDSLIKPFDWKYSQRFGVGCFGKVLFYNCLNTIMQWYL